jgi:hypothetical protein
LSGGAALVIATVGLGWLKEGCQVLLLSVSEISGSVLDAIGDPCGRFGAAQGRAAELCLSDRAQGFDALEEGAVVAEGRLRAVVQDGGSFVRVSRRIRCAHHLFTDRP